MKTQNLKDIKDFSVAVEGQDCKITSVYCADLLSWAMTRAPEGCAWCTVMGNVNTVAVANLTDTAVIVLCEGAVLDQDACQRAKEEGINIVTTRLPSFDAGNVIQKLLEKQH